MNIHRIGIVSLICVPISMNKRLMPQKKRAEAVSIFPFDKVCLPKMPWRTRETQIVPPTGLIIQQRMMRQISKRYAPMNCGFKGRTPSSPYDQFRPWPNSNQRTSHIPK